MIANSPEKIVTASFTRCSTNDRNLFHTSKCLVPISMGGGTGHQGNKFAATMRLVDSCFESCSLLVVDSVHRHTLKIKHPDETDAILLKRALDEGTEWRNKNEPAYMQLTIPYTITHWDKYRLHKNFSKHHKTVSELYNNEISFRKALDDSANEYLKRSFLANTASQSLSYEEAFQCCINYLKEECAGVCVFGGDSFEEYNFMIYPGKLGSAVLTTYEHFVVPNYPNLIKPLSLMFDKKLKKPTKLSTNKNETPKEHFIK
jgi:tRNA-dependent cyclodipeptide synthase